MSSLSTNRRNILCEYEKNDIVICALGNRSFVAKRDNFEGVKNFSPESNDKINNLCSLHFLFYFSRLFDGITATETRRNDEQQRKRKIVEKTISVKILWLQ